MMHLTKKLHLIMLIICCMSQTIQSSYMCDQDGKTELMNYVLQQEAEIKIKKTELTKLCYKYFTRNDKTNILEKRAWITDEDVTQYRKLENECDLFTQDTIENIKIMVLDGANLQARDVHGKSVTDHCCTYEIYYALRDLHAPLSFNEQVCTVIMLGFLGVTTITVGNMILTACYNAYFPHK